MKPKAMIAFLLAAVLLFSLTACNSSAGQQASSDSKIDGAPPSVSVPEKPDVPLSGPASETESDANHTADPAAGPVPLSLISETDNDWLYKDGRPLCHVEWEYIQLSGKEKEARPALAQKLEELNEETRQSCQEISEELKPQAEEYLSEDAELTWYYSYGEDLIVHRADELALSLLYSGSAYTGGAHPEGGSWSLNLDPATGEELTLDDIFVDSSGLPALLEERVRAEYPDIPFPDDIQEIIEEYLEQGLLTWTLGYQGVRFHFNTYDLIPVYAAGSQSVTLWFEESPELFREKYLHVPDQYAVELGIGTGSVSFDLIPGDGKADTLAPFAYMSEYMNYGLLELTINEQTYPLWDYESDDLKLYLACLNESGKQKTYLYLDAAMPNDYHVLSVFEITPTELRKLGELSGSKFAQLFTDPSEFILHTRTEMLSTQTGTRSYHIAPSSGIPEGNTPYFELIGSLVITSLVPLEVSILPEEKPEQIAAGMEFTLLRTDNETYVDTRMADGRECRIFVDTSQWPVTVGGLPREDCFDGMIFAG